MNPSTEAQAKHESQSLSLDDGFGSLVDEYDDDEDEEEEEEEE